MDSWFTGVGLALTLARGDPLAAEDFGDLAGEGIGLESVDGVASGVGDLGDRVGMGCEEEESAAGGTDDGEVVFHGPKDSSFSRDKPWQRSGKQWQTRTLPLSSSAACSKMLGLRGK